MRFKALCIIPHPGEIEIKPLVLCKECRWWHDDGIMTTCQRHVGNGYPADCFCADGDMRKTRLYQYGTITWEGEDDG